MRSLAEAQQPVHQASVRALLCNSHAQAIRVLLGQRRQATREEFGALIQQLQLDCVESPGRYMAASAGRDIAVVAVALLSGMPIERVVQLSVEELVDIDTRPAPRHEDDDASWLRLQLRSFVVAESTRFAHPQKVAFEGLKSGSSPIRAAKRRVRHAMRSLDQRLQRNVAVFWDLARQGVVTTGTPSALVPPMA
jgi:hypothetical protein